MELRKTILLIAVLLEIVSANLLSYHNTFAQTYDTITKQMDAFKNNPQISIGKGGSNSHLGNSPLISINPFLNKIYVANIISNTVSVINSNTGNVTSIRVGILPSALAINPILNKIYVANEGSNTVSVIENDKLIKEIRITGSPVTIEYNYKNIYVLGKNLINENVIDTISVIDTSTDKVIKEIPMGELPDAIAINNYGSFNFDSPYMVYVKNTNLDGSALNTVSVIDGSIDRITAGVKFNIYPSNAGSIWCNNKEYPINIYLYVVNGTKCVAKPNKDFEFSSWVENLNNNSTFPVTQSTISYSPLNSLLSALGMMSKDTSATLDVNRFGTFTVNFKATPPAVPYEYWIPLYGIVVSTLFGWSIPSIIGWIRARIKRKGSIEEYDDIISSLANVTDRKSLDRIKNRAIPAYMREKINEFQYKILEKKLSEKNDKIHE
ncbi:MAG TPA: YncE family protein [Verrucomicrobiae bacterium]|nr:YncE family protein [Candidatus Sulfopaludibacter sp.]HXT82782.1 YncE family protein [Verrucomicrobiae bacterium]